MIIDALLAAARTRRRRAREDLSGEAAELAERGRYRAAGEFYATLEEIEPDNADWSVRLAETQRRLGNRGAEIDARLRAAQRFRRSRHPRRAIAMCGRVLRLAPGHELAQTILAQAERECPYGLDRSPRSSGGGQ
jgi:hypothetical protein